MFATNEKIYLKGKKKNKPLQRNRRRKEESMTKLKDSFYELNSRKKRTKERFSELEKSDNRNYPI